jgi:PKHD-type hydroxylase
VLYPASSLHNVTPITRGERIASFFWVQSMVRDEPKRTLLLQMDIAIQSLAAELGQGHPQLVALTGAYHNLLRMWAEV